METPRRIFLTSDFLMTSEEEQLSNLRWFTDLFTRPIEAATGIRPEQFLGHTSGDEVFSRTEFFDRSGIELNPVVLQFFFDDAFVGRGSLDYLLQHVGEGDLVVGYELSEQTRRLLKRAGITYVDIWLHPIRYLDDILFGMSSSDESVFERLAAYSLDPEHFRLYADRARISTYKGHRRVTLPVAPNSALFVGQTLQDKAVCRHTDGRMLNLLDFQREFEEVGQRFSTVYYSRHPYVKGGDEKIMEYVDRAGFAQVVDWPAYHMLSHPNLRYVFSVSSSVVYEAEYFGKETRFLYRPVIDLSTEFGLRSYATIYQELVSGHFWSDVLAPLMPTEDVPRIVFLDRKDQLRDMLNFYWSYRHVDKVENMRQTLKAVDRRVQRLDQQKPEMPSVRRSTKVSDQSKRQAEELRKAIQQHAVVSFDVFDTLLKRPLARPEDLFDLLEERVREITGGAIPSFREARLAARGWVSDPSTGEEVLLEERYEAIRAKFGLTEEQRDALLELELDAERRLLLPRRFGLELLEQAVAAKKRVVLVSDTYYDRAFVEEVLRKNGIVRYDELFLSSETGLLKHTGKMFQHVVDALGVPAGDILHIGDNPRSDVEQAREAGLSATHVPSPTHALNQNSLLAESFPKRSATTTTLLEGMAASELGDDPFDLPRPSFAGGTADRVGYALVGPILLGFARWLLDNARRDGVEHLYFLARDGDVIKRAYDVVAAGVPDAPRSTYILASRRSVSVAALEKDTDVVALLDANFSPTPLDSLLRNRFGISAEDLDAEVLEAHGFREPQEVVRHVEERQRLRSLLYRTSDVVLENAARERELLLDYYRELGLTDRDERKAVVDIGHHGTMQRALSRLLGDSELGGYYFALFDGGQLLSDAGLRARGYVGGSLSADHKSHPYTRHILMFELLFLNDQGSFVRFEKRGDERVPVTLPLDGEESRVALSRSLHSGAVRFASDARKAFGELLDAIPLEGEEVIAPYAAMLQAPTAIDARPFVGVTFENVYSGRNLRYVIHPEASWGSGTGNSIWPEGAAATMVDGDKRRIPLVIRLGDVTHQLGLLSERKHRKLRRAPREFFEDSRNPFVRRLAFLIKDPVR